MNLKKHIGLIAGFLPVAAMAQTSIDFETENYAGLGVYDTWEQSPFRTNQLSGNYKVISNHLNQVDEVLGQAPNSTEHILAFQRSRFGSNTYGVRMDLKEPFELTTTVKYIHVLINKPVEGRVMVVGLGKRRDRAGQSKETEQFWALASQKVTPNEWNDAVFAVKGNGGIDIYSLVVIPDCEAPHLLDNDFVAYIDEIEINDVAEQRIRRGDYLINFDEDQTYTRTDRKLTGISLKSGDGQQSISISNNKCYNPIVNNTFCAKAGDTVTPTFTYTGSWMNGYVYLDRESDGKFSYDVNEDYTPAAGSDLMSYSNYQSHNSAGNSSGDGNVLNPPAFVIPSDLAPGYYRMRYKVDWSSIDPGGNTDESNLIISNGGAIADVRLNVHSDMVTLTRDGGLNGDIVKEDGTLITKETVPFGQDYTIVAKPASDNFKISYVRVRHGYNLKGDSLVHSTPQYVDEYFMAYMFRDNKLTIPGKYIDGDVIIEPYFVDENFSGNDEPEYALNFDESLTVDRTDRKLNSFKMTATAGGSVTISLPAGTNYVYRNLLHKQVSVVPGDEVTTSITYQGNAMHAYLYVDLNQDGKFDTSIESNGMPSANSEVMAYTYYNGHNSLGETLSEPGKLSPTSLPTFTIPAILPIGKYRARLKIDWNNIDPAGQWSDGGSNQINDNGGFIVDFLLNVHNESHSLEVVSMNGSVNSTGNTALPINVKPFEAGMSLVPTPVAAGYEAESMTILHGHKFDGPQYIHGNKQWSKFTRKASNYTLPKDSIDGDVIITVNYEPTSEAAYKLVFNDEFNEADGTQADASKWSRCERQSSTWNRWCSDHKDVVYMQNGKLVARAIPNPDQATDNVPMITGGVKSQKLFGFTYGKIECRALTNPFSGNFPAIWMMPEDQSAGWPNCGEIDIFEQIDTENIAYHTVHSNWTYNLGNKWNPTSSFSESVAMDRFHTYGFEWDENVMIWYVDGKEVARYAKSTNQDDLDKGQWPFNKHFYLILNQSVGNGSWAANADTSHTYETLFDWVRVYQKDGQNNILTSIANATTSKDLTISVEAHTIVITASHAQSVMVCDLSGRLIHKSIIEGTKKIAVEEGVYIVNGQKIFVR